MTRKELIDHLQHLEQYTHYSEDAPALREAIALLLQNYSTERAQERTETHACDLISRQALCEYALNQKDKSITPNDIMRFPSAQPEIIRCVECKHWICHDRRCGYWNHGVKPLDWCCHAERRTDDGE